MVDGALANYYRLICWASRESENDGTTLPLVVVVGAKIDFHILVPVGSMRPALIAVQDYLVSIYKHV